VVNLTIFEKTMDLGEPLGGSNRSSEPPGNEGGVSTVPDAVFDLDELAADLDDATDDQLAVAADLA